MKSRISDAAICSKWLALQPYTSTESHHRMQQLCYATCWCVHHLFRFICLACSSMGWSNTSFLIPCCYVDGNSILNLCESDVSSTCVFQINLWCSSNPHVNSCRDPNKFDIQIELQHVTLWPATHTTLASRLRAVLCTYAGNSHRTYT